MNREYHLEQLLVTADRVLRRCSYDTISYTEIDENCVLFLVFNGNYGPIHYLGHIWYGTLVPFQSLEWEEVNSDQDSDSGY